MLLVIPHFNSEAAQLIISEAARGAAPSLGGARDEGGMERGKGSRHSAHQQKHACICGEPPGLSSFIDARLQFDAIASSPEPCTLPQLTLL